MKKALVVEDSTVARAIAQRVVESLGWEVRTATNGEDGLAILRSMTWCDLVLTDLDMPRMGGQAFCRQIRKLPRVGNVQILVWTADAALKESALAAGATEVLLKPVSPEVLAACIKRINAPRSTPP